MSSAAYETELVPDRHSRLILAAALLLATLSGSLLVLTLPLGPGTRVGLFALWLAQCVSEALRLRRGMMRIDRIVMSAAGRVRAGRRGALEHSLEVAAGSIVGERRAWLRLRFADGSSYGELLSAPANEREAWRRFQVIWRQRGHFGRSGIS